MRTPELQETFFESNDENGLRKDVVIKTSTLGISAQKSRSNEEPVHGI